MSSAARSQAGICAGERDQTDRLAQPYITNAHFPNAHMEFLLLNVAMYVAVALIVAWTAGALFFDVGGATLLGAVLAVAAIAVALATLVFWQPPWKPFLVTLVAFSFFLRWWFSQQPSQHRNWDPHFAHLPMVALERDAVTINNVRNSEYRGVGDATPRFETRHYRLSELCGVDAIIVSWGSPWMCHPMVVFDFGPLGRVCISIEVRYRVGQNFSLLRSLYRQQELMYVVSDERDAVLRRIRFLPGQDLYLYRLDVGALAIRQWFLEYAGRINALADAPRWYHGFVTNCTTSVYAQGRGRIDWDWRLLWNGSLDRLMYERHLLDQSLPFEELKQQSWINDIAARAPTVDFGDHVRSKLRSRQQISSGTETHSPTEKRVTN